jgi:hypothetical protein
MPSPIADRARLEAAAKRSRGALLTQRARSLETLKSLLLALAGDIRDELDQFGGPDGRIAPTALPTLRAFLEQRLSRFDDRWRTLLDDGLRAAAKIGASLLELVGRTGGDAEVVGQVIEAIRAQRMADGLVLSDRIWRTSQSTRETLRAAIEGAVARGESAAQATARLLRDGLPVPSNLQADVALATAGRIGRHILSLLQDEAPGSPDYLLHRLLRTEINRAYTESYVATVAQHPDVIGVRFNLSPQHPRTDICDLYASANLHGLGPGVYPPGEHPYPAHPNTISYLTTVFRDEVTEADRASKQSAFDWVATLPAHVQDDVLGGTRKGAAFRAGLLQPADLRLPWYAIAARLGIVDPESEPA